MLTTTDVSHLQELVDRWFGEWNVEAPKKLKNAGIIYPTNPPNIYNKLPLEWDDLMENTGGITQLSNLQLENYLENWTRLLGYSYWLRGVWQDRVETLERALNYIKDYIYKKVDGNRELRSAISGSHEITLYVLEKLNESKRPLSILHGKIERWEKIEFAISRAISNRQR